MLFLGLFTDPNDREYPPPSTTTVGVTHESQASVSLMFLPLFDVFRDLLLKQTHSNRESIRLYYKQIDKLTWYRLTVPGFVLVFPSHKRCFLPLLLLFSFILLVDSFSQTFCNALTPQAESVQTLFIFIVATRQDGNCSQLTVVRISPSFDIFTFPRTVFVSISPFF